MYIKWRSVNLFTAVVFPDLLKRRSTRRIYSPQLKINKINKNVEAGVQKLSVVASDMHDHL